MVASHKSSQPQAVKQSREELSGMPVRELKTMLQSRNISFAGGVAPFLASTCESPIDKSVVSNARAFLDLPA